MHSLNVYYRLRDIAIRDMAGKEDPGEYRLSEEQEETVAVIALLHDVCKVGCYCTETKRRKNPETGRWEDYEGYTYKDPLPLGHGEKSLYLIQRHMDCCRRRRWPSGGTWAPMTHPRRRRSMDAAMAAPHGYGAYRRRTCARPGWMNGRRGNETGVV